ncbi:hypothetical protein B0T26DRAFT_747240 [Lasiosphaeria miniovina]|uniref:Heterokaryon incompatibility domain-containing protein n=1 Tax=Lasiosphaeria miniovina TaxID=1954250 RepID=A0AA40B366_9PEZI|nr:uncharacterized protein B0T26DRAFT_747240 [Lasiosphaeria miniovina]KAK0726850.1 hypothetical protein B0T26DRAFT_747240 [Lasiosphaeria miniovina]
MPSSLDASPQYADQRLEEFHSSNVPRYACLSHTWGANEIDTICIDKSSSSAELSETINYFLQLLSDVSNILKSYLAGTSELKYASIARRMLWASKGNTTRSEDLVYSLIGIFDVHIPFLYGEGDRAFLRLQQEINHVSL